LLFATSHRPEGQVTRAASQRLCDLSHEQQIGRSGQEELSRSSFSIDGSLDDAKESGFALYFIEGHGTSPTDERLWITTSRIEYVQVVERRVASISWN
jgi:hypothetical protein